MPSYYSVVQYVPDLIRNERVNVGIIVFDEREKDCYFVEDFKRVRSLGGSVEFVKQAAHTIRQLGVNTLRDIIGQWNESIQFTRPAASLLDLTSLVVDASNRFLVEEVRAEEVAIRSHAAAVKIAKARVAAALRQNVGGAGRKLIKKEYQVEGRYNHHNFDFAVANGHAIHLVEGISFEGPTNQKLENKAKAIAWSIDDIRQRDAALPISVAVLSPRSPNRLYDESARAFSALGAAVVNELEMPAWAESVALAAKGHLPGN